MTQDRVEHLRERGYALLPSHLVRNGLPLSALQELESLQTSFAGLVQDRHMNDGGTYRFRRYSRFRLEMGQLQPLEGNSILQSTEDNPLNGGVVRTFAPLSPIIAAHPLLRALIISDAKLACQCQEELAAGPLQVGVHQVRIVAVEGASGLPTPEGIHLDGESFTFQHFLGRHDASGGAFQAYDQDKKLVESWLQQECLDSVVFRGTTWHSATPITCNPGALRGHRDVFLIDFDPLGD